MPNPISPNPESPNLPQFNSNTHEDNQTIPSDSEDELSLILSSSRESPSPQFQRRLVILERNPMLDYYKINQGRTSTAKINSSVPLGSPHSKATQILYDYALFQPNCQSKEDLFG